MEAVSFFLVLAVLYYTGEFIGTLTKAWVPSVFVIASLFLVGYWTVFPKEIVSMAGLGPPLGGMLVIMFCITHMGTIISIRQLLGQWKVVVITLAGLLGMVLFCWFICIPLIGRAYVVAGLPPLTGGIVAAIMMSQAAEAKGLVEASVLAIAMYAVQGFIGYPITAVMLKLEGRRLLTDFRSGKAGPGTAVAQTVEVEKPRLIPAMPEKFSSPAFILAKLMVVASLAIGVQKLTGGKVNAAVVTLIFGIIATEIGFLDRNSLVKAGSFGFLMFVLMIYVFDGLKRATPEMVASCFGPMALMVLLGVLGLVILSVLAGKLLKVSWPMACAVSLTALYGFPPNVILTEEAAKALANTPEEKQYLVDQMMPQMIVGGFVTVTIASVVIAGIFVNLL